MTKIKKTKPTKATKNGMNNPIRFLIILLLLTVIAGGTINIALSEPDPATKTDIVISDSIAPMKLEIDSKTNNAIETKTVILTNTGDTATEYICYIEQNGGKKDLGSGFELSDSKITLLPGDSKKLKIVIPAQAVKSNSADAEYKLKIIRNPDTQTPVGYIIPIQLTGSDSTGKTSGGKSGAGAGLTMSDPENKKNETKNETKNEMKNETKNGSENKNGKNENNSNGIDDENKYGNDFMKKGGIILLLAFLTMLAAVVGIMIQKKRKQGKE
ncbi:hypothetical protein [Methanimicrococcus blatticola]|uniref:hypothetical protein n=1 Tax=Methanimicrococcus blatticola TaxID=91560 RepID=UPI001060AC4F|nr:hypothetical protein [Methanimicrococcus blatticola]MBZ3935057.1 hypothetical protein [Methanimicrococcus blatticola]MCC2508846.1 hypothetical protein [Methanimicrococcus blatticola]